MSHSPFDNLSGDAKAILLSHSRRKSLAANTIVYFQDDPAHSLYIIERGHVRLSHIMEDGSVALYAIIPQGASFGEVGAFDGLGYSDTASTIDTAELTAISLQWMDKEGAAYNELRTAVARMISKRYRAHTEFARALYLPTLTGRLALSVIRLLNSLGNEIRYQNKTVPVLGPVVTQRDLGAMARGTRENVNKILRAWIADGLVVVEDRHIIVTNRARLEAIAFNM